MKKYLFGLFSFALAIILVSFSSFTKVKEYHSKTGAPSEYFIYSGSGAQTSILNYTNNGTTQPSACDLSNKLCFFRVDDLDNDSDIDEDDFIDSFDNLDIGSTTGTLDDELEIVGQLEKQP